METSRESHVVGTISKEISPKSEIGSERLTPIPQTPISQTLTPKGKGKSPGNIVLHSGSGNVGIGTISPDYKLDVAGGVFAMNLNTAPQSGCEVGGDIGPQNHAAAYNKAGVSGIADTTIDNGIGVMDGCANASGIGVYGESPCWGVTGGCYGGSEDGGVHGYGKGKT